MHHFKGASLNPSNIGEVDQQKPFKQMNRKEHSNLWVNVIKKQRSFSSCSNHTTLEMSVIISLNQLFGITAVKFPTSLHLKQDKKKEIKLCNTEQQNYRKSQTRDFIYFFTFGSLQSKGTWMVLSISWTGVETC